MIRPGPVLKTGVFAFELEGDGGMVAVARVRNHADFAFL